MSRPLKSHALYGINEYSTKWIVIVKRQHRNLCRSFAFSTHGGRESALAQAQAWRDEQIHAQPTTPRRELASRVKANNTSGIAGVRCQYWPDGRPMRWVVHTQVGERLLTKSYGVKSHGFEQARALAIQERERHLALLEGRTSRHPADQVNEKAPVPVAVIQRAPRSTQTGLPGVYLTRNKRTGAPQSWVAVTHRSGKSMIRSFAISVFGDDGARALALAERERQLAVTQQPRSAHVDSPRRSSQHNKK